MKYANHRTARLARPVLALSIAAAALGGSGIAYAADLGGFRTTITSWFEGQKRTVEVEPVEGGYEFRDSQTGEYLGGGGGIAYGDNGEEIPLAPEEVAENFARYVTIEEGGSVMLYYDGLSWNLDSLFEQSDKADVQFEADGITHYATIELEDGKNAVAYSIEEKPAFGRQYVTLD